MLGSLAIASFRTNNLLFPSFFHQNNQVFVFLAALAQQHFTRRTASTGT